MHLPQKGVTSLLSLAEDHVLYSRVHVQVRQELYLSICTGVHVHIYVGSAATLVIRIYVLFMELFCVLITH